MPRDDADLAFPRHDDDDSKKDRGTILVVGGTSETPGAVLLSGLAALSVGAGRLRIATVASRVDVIAAQAPEARVISLPETSKGWLDGRAASRIGELASKADAVLIGPGTTEDDNGALDAYLDAICTSATCPVVVDAGGIEALTRCDSFRAPAILTPNPDELEHLGGEAADVAKQLQAVVALRDATVTIVAPDGRSWTEESSSVGIATSGTGDIASGIVAGLAAQGATPQAAAVWGARLLRMAGDLTSKEIAPIGFLARDLLPRLPRVLPS